jgi:hypothetical protein
MFILNVLFFGFLQFKDMTTPNTYEGFNIFMMIVCMIGFIAFPVVTMIKIIKNRTDL